jgi:GNAT acetyltransferase-like protein
MFAAVIEVRPMRPGDEPAYEQFLAGRQEALVHHSLAYRDVLVDHLGCRAEYLLALDGGEIRGALPIMWTTDGGGIRIANSLPYYGSPGALLGDDAAAAAALRSAWDARATDPATAAATWVSNPFADGPAETPVHDLTDERFNQATPLTGAPPAIDGSARRNVAKARRLGVRVDRDATAMSELCVLHRDNLARIGGRAKDPGFFEAVAQRMEPGREFDVYVARLDGEVAAALLVFWIGAAAEYYTPAIRHERRPDQPLAAILDTALADAGARGLRWFNWGGTWTTRQQGVYRFKRKWGAREVRYRYYTKLNEPALLDATPEDLTARFGHFYVVPFSALRAAA